MKKPELFVGVMYGRSLVVRGEGDELCEGWCQVDGHQDHRVEARDPAAETRSGNAGGPTGFTPDIVLFYKVLEMT